jgi:peroxidase
MKIIFDNCLYYKMFGYTLSLIFISLITLTLTQPTKPQYIFANVTTNLCNLNNYKYCSSLYYTQYRTFDGSCNNVAKPWLGMSVSPYQRFGSSSSSYNSAGGAPRVNSVVAGKKLQDPRTIAMGLLYPNDILTNVSTFHLFFGKLIASDLTDAIKPVDTTGRYMECNCTDSTGNCLILPTSPNDRINRDQACMSTPRSVGSLLNWNCGQSFKEQINKQTAFLDLSSIYGTDNTSSNSLRTFSNGLLITQMIPNNTRPVFKSAPYPANSNQCLRDTPNTPCFQSGDSRMNLNTAITSVSVLLLRQHNRIAQILKNQNSITATWSDDVLYQKARRINIALYQHIIYNEWLPLVIGPALMTSFNLKPLTRGSFNGYSSTVFDQIINEFATAAFRFGHNMVPNKLFKADKSLTNFMNFNLTSFTYTPTDAYTKGGLDSICLGLLKNPALASDIYHSDQMHNYLFDVGVKIGNSNRGSLTALNIQRGRDHGLRPYNSYRSACGLNTASIFSDLQTNIRQDRIAMLQNAYLNVKDIDLYSGGLAENNVPGGLVGQTFASN